MTTETLRATLERVAAGEMSVAQSLETLRDLPFQDLGFAKIDHHRALRQGFPEVVFGLGKTPTQILEISRNLHQSGAQVLVTRTTDQAFALVRKEFPSVSFDPVSRVLQIRGEKPVLNGSAGVLCAGTSDLPVAEEAAQCLEAMGGQVERVYDVGVAGLHRLLGQLENLRRHRALVVVAGMEGALPSVVAGLVSVPVVAVPTSVGYGASFGGLAALLGMLNSCSNGVAVVNIDNGFGAAAFVASILRNGVVG